MLASLRSRLAAALLVFAALASTPAPTRAEDSCQGDCDADGVIAESDLRQVIEAIFAADPTAVCPGLSDGDPTVSDLISAVARSGACVPVGPPVIPTHAVYRSYAGAEIALPIAAEDDGPLDYAADDLPAGAVLEAETGILRWTPTLEQVGAYIIPFRVSDRSLPRSTAEGVLHLRITPLDSCTIPSCDPATGCEGSLVPLTENCCGDGPLERVPEFFLGCPEDAVLMVGRNANSGFGRIQNCDHIRLLAFTQAGVTIRIHFGTTCITTNEIIEIHALLETADKLLVDRDDVIVLRPTVAGFDQKINYVAPLRAAMMSDEGHEANLSITITDDLTGIVLSDTIRVVLTHVSLADLPDLPQPTPPPAQP